VVDVALDATHFATSDFPYTFSYPSSWTVHSDPDGELLSPVEVTTRKSGFFDWAAIRRLRYGVAEPCDADTYVENHLENLNVSSRTETTVDGRPALRLEGTEEDFRGRFQVLLYAIEVKRRTADVLFFFGSDQAFDPMFNRIVSTLRIERALLWVDCRAPPDVRRSAVASPRTSSPSTSQQRVRLN
jgi:hypothetical protein